jgi:hypothetical protein
MRYSQGRGDTMNARLRSVGMQVFTKFLSPQGYEVRRAVTRDLDVRFPHRPWGFAA